MPTSRTVKKPKHLIEVTVTGPEVEAEPNPLPGKGAANVIEPGDSVTWEFTGLRDGHLPLVFFRQLHPLSSGPGSDVDPGPVDLLGPFRSLSLSRDRIVASDADDRYGRFIYKIAVIDPRSDPQGPEIRVLRWIDGLDGENFGGIDKPKTPEGR